MERLLRNIFGPGLVLAALCLGGARLDAATFTASLDRDTIALGESATLSLTFEGSQPGGTPQIKDIPGLQINYVGPSSQFSFVNGQTSSTITYHFTVVAARPGDYTIPALTAQVDGQSLTSEPLKLTVTQPNAPPAQAINSGLEVAFMRLTLPEKEVYAGEMLAARLDIYLRDDVQNFGNFQFTGTPADGFTVGKMAQGSRQRVQIGNRVYTDVPLEIALTANKSGAISLGPFTATVVVELPSSNRGGDPFFQRFFNPGEQRQVTLATDTLNVKSLPLPAEGAPPNFNGTVGNYSMTVTAGPTNVAVGDPITVRVQISGHGALDALTLPDQPAWRDFKAYPPTQNTKTTDQLGIEGVKTFEQIVTPQNTDVHELPAFSFSFFDPGAKTYRTLTQPPVELAVHSGGTTPAPVIAATKTANSQTAASGPFAHQRAIRRARSGRPATVDAPGVSDGAKPARAGLARGFRVAQTNGPPGEQSPFAAAAARRRAGSRRTERFAPPRGGKQPGGIFRHAVPPVAGATGRTAGLSRVVHHRSRD